MIIERPYQAKDNEVNKLQAEIIANWAKRNGETVAKMEIYEMAVFVITESGRNISANISQGRRSRYRNVREHFYMNEKIDGKRKRIPKTEW